MIINTFTVSLMVHFDINVLSYRPSTITLGSFPFELNVSFSDLQYCQCIGRTRSCCREDRKIFKLERLIWVVLVRV